MALRGGREEEGGESNYFLSMSRDGVTKYKYRLGYYLCLSAISVPHTDTFRIGCTICMKCDGLSKILSFNQYENQNVSSDF